MAKARSAPIVALNGVQKATERHTENMFVCGAPLAETLGGLLRNQS